jgi:hypothetical protein
MVDPGAIPAMLHRVRLSLLRRHTERRHPMTHAPLADNAVTGPRDQAGPPDTRAPASVTPGDGPCKTRSPLAYRAAIRRPPCEPLTAHTEPAASGQKPWRSPASHRRPAAARAQDRRQLLRLAVRAARPDRRRLLPPAEPAVRLIAARRAPTPVRGGPDGLSAHQLGRAPTRALGAPRSTDPQSGCVAGALRSTATDPGTSSGLIPAAASRRAARSAAGRRRPGRAFGAP